MVTPPTTITMLPPWPLPPPACALVTKAPGAAPAGPRIVKSFPMFSVMSPPLPPPLPCCRLDLAAGLNLEVPGHGILIGHALAGPAESSHVIDPPLAIVRSPSTVKTPLTVPSARSAWGNGGRADRDIPEGAPVASSPSSREPPRRAASSRHSCLRPGGRPEPLSPRAGRMRSREPGSPTQRS